MSDETNRETVISLRFYEELNDFLPEDNRKQTVWRKYDHRPSVKDIIESCSVPHTEVDLILVNNESVSFDYQVADGDRIAVYPVFESIDIASLSKVRPEPLRELNFILDVHLGKLAKYLRLLGFDSRYDNNYEDDEIVAISQKTSRIILTRDRGILKRKEVNRGYFIRHKAPFEQVIEVIRRFHLEKSIRPFSRCLRCNGVPHHVAKESVIEKLEPGTRMFYSEFRQCANCQRIYWDGSHQERMVQFIERVLARLEEE